MDFWARAWSFGLHPIGREALGIDLVQCLLRIGQGLLRLLLLCFLLFAFGSGCTRFSVCCLLFILQDVVQVSVGDCSSLL